MPRKPIKSKKGKKLTGASEMHLLTGVCLISFSCQLCSGNHNESYALGVDPYTLNQDAKEIWLKHRERLLTIWRDPEGRGRLPGGSGFRGDTFRGAGRFGLPAWAEIKFEGAKMPKLDRKWPQDVQEAWKFMKA
jgi:hypothetical protein